jgi:hypothetical protein
MHIWSAILVFPMLIAMMNMQCMPGSDDPNGNGDPDSVLDELQEDGDGDGIFDASDNCPRSPNAGQEDADADGVGDVCDNCLLDANPDQEDADEDGNGDPCDRCPGREDPPSSNDSDADGIYDECDNCPLTSNPGQENADNDEWGDECDSCPTIADLGKDVDDDGVGDLCDNCPEGFNPSQSDTDDDAAGDVCDNCASIANGLQTDADSDEFGDECDNCPDNSNPDQIDSDSDGPGDECDNCPETSNPNQTDSDGDGIGDECDNCPDLATGSQLDTDEDGLGDECDPDDDNDGVLDGFDNCPKTANADQIDGDQDGLGDACDTVTEFAISYFSDGQEGWSAFGDGTLTYESTGGNGGGYLRMIDQEQDTSYFFDAPSKFLGDQSSAYGGILEFDIRIEGDGETFDTRAELTLVGAGITLHYNTSLPTRSGWNGYTIRLDESKEGWGKDEQAGGGAVPTQEEFRSVLAALETIRIRGEYIRGTDTACLDNVRLYFLRSQ